MSHTGILIFMLIVVLQNVFISSVVESVSYWPAERKARAQPGTVEETSWNQQDFQRRDVQEPEIDADIDNLRSSVLPGPEDKQKSEISNEKPDSAASSSSKLAKETYDGGGGYHIPEFLSSQKIRSIGAHLGHGDQKSSSVEGSSKRSQDFNPNLPAERPAAPAVQSYNAKDGREAMDDERDAALEGDNQLAFDEAMPAKDEKGIELEERADDGGGGEEKAGPILSATHLTFFSDTVFIGIASASCALAVIAIIIAIVCWCRLRDAQKKAGEIDYPTYGMTGPGMDGLPHHTAGGGVVPTHLAQHDRKLAHSAQMYHYQHQKEKMIALEAANGSAGGRKSGDEDSEEEEEVTADGEIKVYEFPGLAPTGEMEVTNPLYKEGPGSPVANSNNNLEEQQSPASATNNNQ